MTRDTKKERQSGIFIKTTVILTVLLVILEICFSLLLVRYLETEKRFEAARAKLEKLQQEQAEAQPSAEEASSVQVKKVTGSQVRTNLQMEQGTAPQIKEGLQTEREPGLQTEEETGVQTAAQMEEKTGNTDETEAVWEVSNCAAGTIVTPEEIADAGPETMFQSSPIVEGDEVYSRIYGNSYIDNYDISLDQLRYLKVVHYNFSHELQVGELIVNVGLGQDYLEIFKELYDAEYEIESLYLIDNYWTGDGASSDTASIEENNSSAFCYRLVTGGSSLSNHALGCAIDINPQQNPYVTFYDGYAQWSHENANDYINRDSGLPHVITQDDDCYQIFIKHGFEWGGNWNNPKDYQHFEKKVS